MKKNRNPNINEIKQNDLRFNNMSKKIYGYRSTLDVIDHNIILNRNKFAHEYHLVRYISNIPRYIQYEYCEYLCRDNLHGFDHVECYEDINKNYVLINSPYSNHNDMDLNNLGWTKIYSLYQGGVTTYVKIIPQHSRKIRKINFEKVWTNIMTTAINEGIQNKYLILEHDKLEEVNYHFSRKILGENINFNVHAYWNYDGKKYIIDCCSHDCSYDIHALGMLDKNVGYILIRFRNLKNIKSSLYGKFNRFVFITRIIEQWNTAPIWIQTAK